MTFKTSYNAGLGQPAIDLRGVDTTPRVALGTVLKGFDDLLGEGEFIYLPGTVGTLAGDAVAYNLAPGAASTTRLSTGLHASSGVPVAVAVAAVPGGSFGWYQINGLAIVNVNANSVANGRVFIVSQAGSFSTTSGAAGTHVVGAIMSSDRNTPATGQSYVTLSRPSVQGQAT